MTTGHHDIDALRARLDKTRAAGNTGEASSRWRKRRSSIPSPLDGSTPAVIGTSACDAAEILRDVAPAASQGFTHQGFTRLTIRGRSHTLPRHVASEAEHERVQAPCSRDFQLLAAKQV